jgi:hypothetical protein
MTKWSYFYVIENQLLNMSEAINSNEILYELKAIREDLDYIKGHMVDIDSILTEKDYLSIQEYRKEKASGLLTSHEDLKNELGI